MIKPAFLDAVAGVNKTGRVVLEIGLQTIHAEEQKLIQRPTNMRLVRERFADLHRRGIESEVSLIFGLPRQTVASFRESIQFCKDMGVRTIYAFPLMLLRGTPLHEQKEEFGIVESSTESYGKIPRIQGEAGIPHVVQSDSFSYQEWQEMAEMAEALYDYNQSNKHHYTSSK